MYDIKPLEKEWKRYRKRKLRPWYIAGFGFIVLSLTAIIFPNNEKIDFSALSTYFKTTDDTSALKEKRVESNILLDGALSSLEVEDSVIDVVAKVIDKPLNILVDIPILEDKNERIIKEVPVVRKRVHLDIVETTSVTAYKDVEKRFLQSHDIDDSLFLARSYYKKGNYNKAEHWALQTNKLDRNNEESLFIFVKSKIKLGRKNEAIAILTTYTKRSNSQEAKKLLYRIQNDKSFNYI